MDKVVGLGNDQQSLEPTQNSSTMWMIAVIMVRDDHLFEFNQINASGVHITMMVLTCLLIL